MNINIYLIIFAILLYTQGVKIDTQKMFRNCASND